MAKASQPSKTSDLLPLLILLIVLLVLGAIGFIVYSVVQDIANKTEQKMEKKNIRLSKGGMKVGVKDVTTEKYEEGTQK